MERVFQDEYPFSFINGPLSLATIASTELSLGLWRVKVSNRGTSVLETNFSCSEFFSVPSRIKDIIDENIISVGEELQKWVTFTSKLFFCVWRSVLPNFEEVVFDPNGRISYSKSAAKAITRLDRNEIKFKFQIASVFCLEDEIKRLRPLISKNSEFLRSYHRTELLNYWYCLMFSRKDRAPNINIWKQYCDQNWASVRYFWHRLNDELKVPTTLKLFRENNMDAFVCLLPNLNEAQAQVVFEAKACEILSVLTSNPEYIEHVLDLWSRMENFITEEAFLQLIQRLWKLAWNTIATNRLQQYKFAEVLMGIWTRALDRFRSYVLNRSAEFFNKLHGLSTREFVLIYGHNMEFLLDLLRNNSAEFRSTVWSQNWKKIVVRAKPVCLKRFLELCLPDAKSISDFKSKELLNFKIIITSFLRSGLYADLAEYLNFCLENTALEKEASKKILANNMGVIISTLLVDKNFENFNLFVEGLFSDSDSATKFKQKLLLSWKSVKSLLVIFNVDGLYECQPIIRRFATSIENLQEIKTKFLDHSRIYLTSMQSEEFNATEWNELLEWCAKNEDEIEAFKKSLDIDEIFEFCFETYAQKSWYLEYRCFSGRLFFYDHFSSWYFDNEQAKRDFKVEKMNTYDKVNAIRSFFKKTNRFSIIRRMLKWAFDNDEKKIKKFWQRLVLDKALSPVITAAEVLRG